MIAEPNSDFHYRMPWWIKKGLAWLSLRKGRDANQLIDEALIKTHPEILRFKPQENQRTDRIGD